MLLRLDNLIFGKLEVWLWMVHNFHFKNKVRNLILIQTFSKNNLVFLQFENRAFLHHRIKHVLAAGELDHQQARRWAWLTWRAKWRPFPHPILPQQKSQRWTSLKPAASRFVLSLWKPYPLWNQADLWTSDVLNKQSAFSTVSCHVISGCLLLDHHCEVWHE